ncbi:Ger(x)C family spore germination protein [Tepidanaerobacter acetatoxydans]|uniref:Ger(x)C family spore germination protein n=1 Tax=Tepidanaerobacter acetatoxydans TaxID=499229 RepID=UPI001BD68C9C|nr:Ger(x)C family spore germination protein [Tepidanaerobacter acetatoxydans]
MKKCFIICLAVILLVVLTGCWDRSELDAISIVTAVGVDKSKTEEKILTTFQIMKPSALKTSGSSSSGEQEGVWTLSSTGYTVFDAVRNATMQTERKLFFSENKVIVIGEEVAKSGIAPFLDFFLRDPEPRRLSWLLIAKGEASDIIKAKHEQENIPSKAIRGMIKASRATSTAVQINLNDFAKCLSTPGMDPVACRIELIGDGKQSDKKICVTGAAVFKKDKLVGWLDRPETRGLNWVLGKVSSGIIVVKSPKEEDENIALEIVRAGSKITPEIRDGKITITVEIHEEGNPGEQMSSVQLSAVEDWKELEKRKAQVIKNEINAVLDKAQKEWGTDIFGFGEAIHRKYPKEWKELKGKWRDEFPKVDIQVKVDAKLRTAGVSAETSTVK